MRKKVWPLGPGCGFCGRWNPGEGRDAKLLVQRPPDFFFSWDNLHGVVRSRQGTGLFPMGLLFFLASLPPLPGHQQDGG